MTKPLSINEKARRDCVRHWERMLKLTRKDIEDGKESPYGENCAFCNIYVGHRKACVGCPVSNHTGKFQCLDTPYYEARMFYRSISNGKGKLTSFRKAVRDEIKFLKSLEID